MTTDDARRRSAEALVAGTESASADDTAALSPEDIRRALHELRVHQVELEAQNDELRRTQVELDASRARYLDLYDLAPVGYVTLSESGLMLEANLTAATLLGMARTRLVTQLLSRFVFKEDVNAYYRHRKHLFTSREPQAFDLRMVREDGTHFWAHFDATASHDAAGAPVCRMTLSDITDHKRADEEKARLEGLLRRAQKMEFVGRLARGVAHEFNNMLGVILGNTELALDQVTPDQPLHAELEEVRKAAARSADLTRQLLAFAREQTVSPRVLDLNETVAGTLTMLRRLIGEDIRFAWQPGAHLWPVKIDPAQMDQILTRLCVNARDAIAGVGTITVATANAVDDADWTDVAEAVPGEYVRVTVSDTGCGMTAETRAHLFEPFFTTKGVGEGTGLGLASVSGAVEQNGGVIQVRSVPGAGTTFRIYLPRHVGQGEYVQTGGATGPAARGHETILLVEDEPAILRLTTTMLERQGYKVLGVSTPGDALQLARAHAGPIHLLLTDVIMPDMNGRALATHVQSIHPHVERLFMSGYTADLIADHGVVDERVSFIQKPFSIKQLAAKVREALDRKQPGP